VTPTTPGVDEVEAGYGQLVRPNSCVGMDSIAL